jgi:hypothetical protein
MFDCMPSASLSPFVNLDVNHSSLSEISFLGVPNLG